MTEDSHGFTSVTRVLPEPTKSSIVERVVVVKVPVICKSVRKRRWDSHSENGLLVPFTQWHFGSGNP